MRRPLFTPVEQNSKRNPNTYKEHTTSFKTLIGPEGMRVIGKAYDAGIIRG